MGSEQLTFPIRCRFRILTLERRMRYARQTLGLVPALVMAATLLIFWRCALASQSRQQGNTGIPRPVQ